MPSAVGRGSCRPTEQGPDAGPQLGQADRLGDVVVGALFEGRHLVALLFACRQDEDRGRRFAANGPQEGQPVAVG